MRWEGSERKPSLSARDTILVFAWRSCEKSRLTSDMLVDVPAEFLFTFRINSYGLCLGPTGFILTIM
jgi:hypothetical protein